MRQFKKFVVFVAFSGILSVSVFANETQDKALVEQGEKIFTTKSLGNCIACHDANGKNINGPGSLGPKLQYLSLWPKEALYEKIYDPYTTNPTSAMPAFGKNGWLSDEEIDALVAYLKTIK